MKLIRRLLCRIQMVKSHWKFIIHILFGTSRFGVNNNWWSDFNSLWAVPFYDRINPLLIYDRYKRMKFRAKIGFLSKETCERIGW